MNEQQTQLERMHEQPCEELRELERSPTQALEQSRARQQHPHSRDGRSAKRARNKGPEGCWPSVGAALTARLTWEAFERLLTREGALRCLACLKGYYVNLFPSPLHRDSDNNLELRAPDGSARLRCVPAQDLPGRGRAATAMSSTFTTATASATFS